MATFGYQQCPPAKETAKFLLKLKEVCRIGEVVDGFQGLISHSLSVVKASVRDVLGNTGINFSDVEGLDEAFRNDAESSK